MDMKRILQAMDGVATKPVVGADSMARFLRVVKEAEQVPAMPDITGLQAGQPKDLGDGSKVTVNADGTVSYQGGWGTYVYNGQGQHIKTQSPSFAGYSQEVDPTGKVTQQNYNQGPMNIQKGPQGTNVGYNLAGQELQTTLKESKTPHKVALPVQMAMQHYQQKETAPVKKSLGVSKYFHKVEEEIAEQQAHKRQLINQYASTIAERVLMKEGKAVKQRLDPKCWTGKHKEGTKVKGGVRVNNCVPNESVNEHEAGWDRHGQGPGMQNYVVDEAPLEFDKNVPMASTIHSHKGVNPASIESRIMRARGQLQELAKMAEHNDPLMWQHIARLFPELAMNIEQIDHGLRELGSIRRKGGRNSKNIPQHLDPSVNETVLNTIKPKATTPKAIKPKAKTSTCRAGQTQTGMQIKDGKSVPKCSVTGIKK
jgi:hypothetical protein